MIVIIQHWLNNDEPFVGIIIQIFITGI